MQLRYERRNDRIEGNVQSETLLFAIRVAHLAFSVIHSCAVQAHYIKHKLLLELHTLRTAFRYMVSFGRTKSLSAILNASATHAKCCVFSDNWSCL